TGRLRGTSVCLLRVRAASSLTRTLSLHDALPICTIRDYSGNKFARAPETTIGADAEYEFLLPSGGAFVLGTDWAYQSRIYYSSVDQTDPFQQQGGYTLGNARLSYRTANEDLEIAAYVRNLTDKTYDLIT